jgi:hypothetical protein
MKTTAIVAVFGAWSTMLAISAYAGGGTKRTSESCTDDNECARGHCYSKKDGDKVCVDCSPSEISDYRGQIQRFCKDEFEGCTSIPQTAEVPEDYFTRRISTAERCISARENENRACWNGGDSGHREAVEVVERAKRNCYDEWNTRKGAGGIYTCSESTYFFRDSETGNACAAYGTGCANWSKDERTADCDAIEDAMKLTNKCVEAIERLDSDCLPQLSRFRENQFGRAKRAYDVCKEVLDYKKEKKLCK